MFEAFWDHTKIPLIVLLIITRKFTKKKIPFTLFFPFSSEIFLTQKRLFWFLFPSWRLLHQRRTKANDTKSSKRRLYAIYIFFTNEAFVLSLVIISVWWEWVGDRHLLGDIKILPWKCRYRLGIKVAIVLISISKKLSPGGNQP